MCVRTLSRRGNGMVLFVLFCLRTSGSTFRRKCSDGRLAPRLSWARPRKRHWARFDDFLRLLRNGTFECRKAESLNVRGNILEITLPCSPHLPLAVEPPATQA